MTYLLVIASAMVVSLFVIPVMIKLAPRLGMIDVPNERKVHSIPIPRVGGWGIIIGAMLPILFLVRMDEFLATFVFGAFTLLMFGALDDSKEMGHYPKFFGQFLAVIPLVTFGGICVVNFPLFAGMELPAFIGIPFTVLALVGMINAANHADGLDGLAGGETIISFGAFALLSYLSNAHLGIVISISALGGILGFLRYNAHPASVFMGDGGSQFLGFALGVLAVFITQKVDTSLSPACVLFLLGLPVVDILVVFYKRVIAGDSWFRATRNHIHHRLLDLGFPQGESVVIIYAIHALFVFSGIWLRHVPDSVILCVYLLAVLALYVALGMAEKRGWKMARQVIGVGELRRRVRQSKNGGWVLAFLAQKFLGLLVPLYLIAMSTWVSDIPRELGVVSAAIGVAMLLHGFGSLPLADKAGLPISYIAASLVIFLYVCDRPTWGVWWLSYAEIVTYSAVGVAVLLSIFFSPGRRRREFQVTVLDYLAVLIGIGALPFIRAAQQDEFDLSLFVIVAGVFFYACKLLASERRSGVSWLNIATLTALFIIAARGLGLVAYQPQMQLAGLFM